MASFSSATPSTRSNARTCQGSSSCLQASHANSTLRSGSRPIPPEGGCACHLDGVISHSGRTASRMTGAMHALNSVSGRSAYRTCHASFIAGGPSWHACCHCSQLSTASATLPSAWSRPSITSRSRSLLCSSSFVLKNSSWLTSHSNPYLNQVPISSTRTSGPVRGPTLAARRRIMQATSAPKLAVSASCTPPLAIHPAISSSCCPSERMSSTQACTARSSVSPSQSHS
mmetsp:Transcript_1006/g.2184  ORF Transcript_1006/g.2184 Transcript_1006/m.2184 type:complete len:229 (-) Transcript_1006:307-993(-)